MKTKATLIKKSKWGNNYKLTFTKDGVKQFFVVLYGKFKKKFYWLKTGSSYSFYYEKGYKYAFLKSIELVEPKQEKREWKCEVKQTQLNELINQYNIKDLEQIKKRLTILKQKGLNNSREYFSLLIVKHKKFLTNKIDLTQTEQHEAQLLNFIAWNWDLEKSLFQY